MGRVHPRVQVDGFLNDLVETELATIEMFKKHGFPFDRVEVGGQLARAFDLRHDFAIYHRNAQRLSDEFTIAHLREQVQQERLSGREAWERERNELVERALYVAAPEPADRDDHEEEVQDLAGGGLKNYKCPLSKDYPADPIQSQVCGHVFSEMAMKSYLQQAANGQRVCPVAGCGKTISLSACTSNPGLLAAVRDKQRQDVEGKAYVAL